MTRGRTRASSPGRVRSPPWKVAKTGMPSARPTAAQTSKRGYSYSWQSTAATERRRSSRASASGGVAA